MSKQKKWPGDGPDKIQDDQRRPFETLDFEKLLSPPRADDPPYRPWWVVNDSQGR